MGLDASVSPEPDVGGFARALKARSMAFAADDEVFAGMNLRNGAVSLNHDATGRAYAAALEIRAGCIGGKPVALIGAGRVGASAAAYLCRKGARVFAYDPAIKKVEALAHAFPKYLLPCSSIRECLDSAELVLLAAPGKDLINAGMARGRIFSVPAIPVGLTRAAIAQIGEGCMIHDTLEMGVATMAADIV
jgi:lactate dehydrogenase-like 2-hydroxyacid dehydrogenase